MIFEKTAIVKAPLQKVQDFLWDPQRLASCIEGCQKVEVIEPQKKYTALVEAKVGPFKTNFAMDLEVLEIGEFHIKARAEGKDSRIAASLKQQIELHLKKILDNETELSFKTDVNILGKLATLGHWMIKKKADELMGLFVSRMKAEIEEDGGN
jgi:carbon monoxide dehydrogenase subunit G